MIDVQLPEVQAVKQTARFFKKGELDFVEISMVGDKNNTINKVKPEHMAKFRAEWNAYCDGAPMQRRPGTPLRDHPTIEEQREKYYIDNNIHNLEELSALSDGQCQALGHGALTERENAKKLLANRALTQREQAHKAIMDASAKAQPVSDAKAQGDLTEIKTVLVAQGDAIAKLGEGLNALAAVLAAKKPGRPKKEQAGE